MIRRGSPNDARLLHELGTKTFVDTFGNTCTKNDMHEVLSLFFNEAKCINELSDPTDHFYFFEESGIAKGYYRINAKHPCPISNLEHANAVELVRLYVLKEYHGSNVATELMNHAIEFAYNHQYDTVYLSVWEYNFRARGFYEKHGFVNTGIENDFPLGTTPQTDLWFVKHL